MDILRMIYFTLFQIMSLTYGILDWEVSIIAIRIYYKYYKAD